MFIGGYLSYKLLTNQTKVSTLPIDFIDQYTILYCCLSKTTINRKFSIRGQCGTVESDGVGLVAGAEQHGVVGVPAEGAVTAGVRSVVHVVGPGVRRGGVRGGVGVTRAALEMRG